MPRRIPHPLAESFGDEMRLLDPVLFSTSLVYFLLNGTDVVYVGCSEDFLCRGASHRHRYPEVNRVFYMVVDHKRMRAIEHTFIFALQPKYNTHSKKMTLHPDYDYETIKMLDGMPGIEKGRTDVMERAIDGSIVDSAHMWRFREMVNDGA